MATIWDLLQQSAQPKKAGAGYMSVSPRSVSMAPASANQQLRQMAQQAQAVPDDFVAQAPLPQAQAAPASPLYADRQSLLNQLSDFNKSRLEEEQADIDDYSKSIMEYGAQQQNYNLTPLATLLDQWYGGNLSSAAKAIAPPSPAERQKELMGMKAQLQNMKQGLSKSQAGLIERQLDNVNDQLKEERLYEAFKQKSAGKQAPLSPGQKAADVAAGKEYADYIGGGGSESIAKNIGLLESAISDLEGPDEVSGGISGFAGEAAQDALNPRGAAVRDKIRSAIQGTLKQILGGQFTEKEAQATFSRAYNPRLSDEENIRRAKVELEALKAMANKKQSAMGYFEKSGGSLGGFKGAKQQAAPAQQEVAAGELDSDKKKRLEELRARKARGEF